MDEETRVVRMEKILALYERDHALQRQAHEKNKVVARVIRCECQMCRGARLLLPFPNGTYEPPTIEQVS